MEPGEGERTDDGEVTMEAVGARSQEAVDRGLAGSVRVQRVDGVALMAGSIRES